MNVLYYECVFLVLPSFKNSFLCVSRHFLTFSLPLTFVIHEVSHGDEVHVVDAEMRDTYGVRARQLLEGIKVLSRPDVEVRGRVEVSQVGQAWPFSIFHVN